ncbi:MAG: autotransporter-associated beta strand repeat-containing protein [Luteolibacter sp.]
MKSKNPRFFTSLIQLRFPTQALGLAVVVSCFSMQSAHASTWVGSTSQNWNTAANWDSNPANPTGNFTINIATAGVYPIISATSAFTPSDIIVGSGSGATGKIDQTAGTTATGNGNWLNMGRDGGTGTYNQTGGTLNAGEIHLINTGTSGNATLNVGGTVNSAGNTAVFDGQNGSVTGQGIVNVNSGGTLKSEGDLILAFAGSGSGEVNVAAGGIVNVATTTKRWMIMNVWDTTQGRMIVNGGTVNLNANTDIQFSTGSYQPGSSQGTSSVTLNSGAITSWSGNQTGAGNGVINLNNNGTSTGINNTFNLNGGTLTIGGIVSGQTAGSRVFNFNSGVLKPTANSGTFFNSGVASTANVRNGGAVIDSNGFNITIGQALVHSTVSGDAASDGGLTKSGTGTLTLSGANTYNGNTTVNAGQLTLADNATLKFVAGASGVNNKITGTGTVQLDGDFTIDTTGASTTIGDSWTLVNVGTLNETYGATFSVVGWSEVTAGVWKSPSATAPFFRFTKATGVLAVIGSNDSDADGLDDLWEDHYFGNNDGIVQPSDLTPQNAAGDPDGDGYTNAQEYAGNTAPNNATFTPADTDGDGLGDLWEDQYFGNNDGIVQSSDLTAQNASGDPDGDLATNLMEFNASSDPLSAGSWPDQDNDSMNDGWEIHFFGNLAKDGTADTDGDGYTDVDEHAAHTDPTLATGTRVSPIWATLAHRWSFNGNLNDSVGGSNATIVDVGANDVILGATTVQMTGGAKADSDYVKLGTNLLPKSTTPVTIELWAKQDVIRNWSRIFDFQSGTGEYLMMAWTRNTDNATDRLEFKDGATLTMDNVNQPYGVTDEYHIVVTLEPLAGTNGQTRVSIYSALSGATDLGPAKAVAETNVNLVNFNDALDALGYSPFPDDTASATYNEVRMWNGALFGWMREKLHDQGPDNAAIPDADNDFMPDAWETQYFSNTTTATSLAGNNDGDAFTNREEYVAGSNPNNVASTPEDLDGDGLLDTWEVSYFGNITAQNGSGDPDGDGLTNEQEETNGTDPTSDEDGLLDAWEVFFFGSVATQVGTDDSDGDGVTNANEYLLSQPNNTASTPTDVNGDGIADSAQHTLAAVDVLGTSSFNAAQNWSDSLAPASGQTYIDAIGNLRTPASVGDFTFAGARLDLLDVYNGRPALVIKNDGVTTIPFLTLNGAYISHASTVNFVDTIAGAIDIRGPLPSEIRANNGPFVINAVISGSSRLDLTGAGTVTLAAANTHTGNLNDIGGGLILSNTGSLKFAPTANGVNNAITGTGAATLNGAFNINLAGASTGSGSTWDLITTTGTVTIGSTFTVTGFTADAGAVGVRKWTSGSYQFDEATGILSVAVSADSDADGMTDTWEMTYFGGLTQGATGDFDGDGTDNLTEFRLGLIPNNGTSRFAVTTSDSNLADGYTVNWQGKAGLTFTVQRSTSLAAGSWTVIYTVTPVADGPQSFTDPSPVPTGKSFYRVTLQP